MSTNRFKDRLIAAREAAKLSQTDLGKLTEMAPTQISRYEAGRAVPRRAVAHKLASALQVDPSWLLDGEFAPEPQEMLVSGDPAQGFEKVLIPSDVMSWVQGTMEGRKCSMGDAIVFLLRRDQHNATHAPTGSTEYPTVGHFAIAMTEQDRMLKDLQARVAELTDKMNADKAAIRKSRTS